MARVLLVEDDPRVRAAVRALIAGAPDRYTLVESDHVADGRAKLREHRPDILLLDLELPDGSGLELLDARSASSSSVLPIVMTVFDDDVHVFDSLRAGAIGYLLKDDIFSHLIAGLEDALAGGSPMSSSIARRVLRSFRPPSEPSAPRAVLPPEPVLTARELEVVSLLAHGCTYDEIARMLTISTNTVRNHIRSTYEKLHVSSKTEATLEAMRLGLIPRR